MKTEKYKKIAIIQTRNKILLEFWKKNAGQAELNRWAFTPLRIWSPHLTPAKISPAQS